MGIDDPVGATSVHGIGGFWGKFSNYYLPYLFSKLDLFYRYKLIKQCGSGRKIFVLHSIHAVFNIPLSNENAIFAGVIAVGLFADNPTPLTTTNGRKGLFKGDVIFFIKKEECLNDDLCRWRLVSARSSNSNNNLSDVLEFYNNCPFTLGDQQDRQHPHGGPRRITRC